MSPDQLKSPEDAAKLINTLIDYGGKPELQTLSVKLGKLTYLTIFQ